jgi:hypothetical protein
MEGTTIVDPRVIAEALQIDTADLARRRPDRLVTPAV